MKFFALVLVYLSSVIFTNHLWAVSGFSDFYTCVGMVGTWGFITLWFEAVNDKIKEGVKG